MKREVLKVAICASDREYQTRLREYCENYLRERSIEARLEVFESGKEYLKKDVLQKYQRAEQTFAGVPKEDQEFLQKFSFICMLSFDVYVKKLMIEKLVDELAKEQRTPEEKSDKKSGKENKS